MAAAVVAKRGEIASSSLYLVHMILAYLAMMVAMTYQVELVVYLVCGMFLGHLAFNAKMSEGANPDACCSAGDISYGSVPTMGEEHAPLISSNV
mmetsp:Transcript_49144/g.98893  ORF Transcript_49144/g.98893 Transcript_49144/m.98893 type:complete len:94 (-) Transcript_49144:102-383(-)